MESVVHCCSLVSSAFLIDSIRRNMTALPSKHDLPIRWSSVSAHAGLPGNRTLIGAWPSMVADPPIRRGNIGLAWELNRPILTRRSASCSVLKPCTAPPSRCTSLKEPAPTTPP